MNKVDDSTYTKTNSNCSATVTTYSTYKKLFYKKLVLRSCVKKVEEDSPKFRRILRRGVQDFWSELLFELYSLFLLKKLSTQTMK